MRASARDGLKAPRPGLELVADRGRDIRAEPGISRRLQPDRIMGDRFRLELGRFADEDCRRHIGQFFGRTVVVLATGEDPSKVSFLIEGSGDVKIYDKSGLLVKRLTAPAYWDGRLDGGEIKPGLYVIEVNSKYQEVTVIK